MFINTKGDTESDVDYTIRSSVLDNYSGKSNLLTTIGRGSNTSLPIKIRNHHVVDKCVTLLMAIILISWRRKGDEDDIDCVR